ncbi:CGNR zinc finger domain-containing protein [Nonomuraea turcica]|uniref:CGNR zinc finger domain-containing protein n=1 Tax=Nonomuraea sp. G32 TaxID=3067274 RepID=UPI00273C1B2B|nr:CGNR zinc finger domain-containing protein [Nonomuraea sp. G32]MDP4509707.1 CGNR zinc finger domain-containing protein [Nonomuraea sp. G32]
MNISINDYAVGAAVATGLVNTSPDVRGEALPDVDALTAFLGEHGVRADALAGGRLPDGDDLRQVHLLRREVRLVLEAETEERIVAGAIVLAGWAGRAPELRREGDGGWQWYVPTVADASLAAELAALIGIGVLGTVRALGAGRLRRCAAPGCRGVFVDTSRGGRRAYCAPDLCGNRVNVAGHRARRRTTSEGARDERARNEPTRSEAVATMNTSEAVATMNTSEAVATMNTSEAVATMNTSVAR